MKALALPQSPSRRLATLAAFVALLAIALAGRSPRPAAAWTASATLIANSPNGGSGSALTISGNVATIQVSLNGARGNANYAIFSCEPLTGGDFDCVGKNKPPDFQLVQIAPKALSPVILTLVQQGTLVTDQFGNGSVSMSMPGILLPDTPHSTFNAVHLVNTTDATDSYTALDLQGRVQPFSGLNTFTPVGVTTVLGVPVYVLAQFPGYVFPVAITALNGVPFVSFITVPLNVFSAGVPFTATVGLCTNGRPPIAQPLVGSGVVLFC